MAYYGLSKPIIAKRNEATGTYSEAFQCGEAIGTSIDPQYAEGKQYGDNRLVEQVKIFREADLTLDVTRLPLVAETVMFGHHVDAETGKVTYKASDRSNYVGYGFVITEIEGGEQTHTAAFIPKAKFEVGQESYSTRGENIEFQNPSLSGKAFALPNEEWRIKQTFDTYEEAVLYVAGKLGLEVPDLEPPEEPEEP
jgi:phi13 family phage major tail protein